MRTSNFFWKQGARQAHAMRTCVILFCIFSMVYPSANLQVSADEIYLHQNQSPYGYIAQYPPPPPPRTAPLPVKKKSVDDSKQVLELSEDKSNANDRSDVKPVDAKPISVERLKELAAMLPPMKTSVEKTFAPISYTRQPPPVTKVIEREFPPKNSSGQSSSKPEIVERVTDIKSVPLKVTRISHVGQVGADLSLKISFNQPMLSVSSPETSDANVPVKLTPQPRGVWHWIGTQTIEFSAKAKSLPRATTFKIEIPAGTTSVLGAKLETTYKSSFETPAPFVDNLEVNKSSYADVAVSLSPVMVLHFNQRVDPSKVLKFVSAKVGNKVTALRLATPSERTADFPHESEEAPNPSDVFLKPTVDLPRNSEVKIVISPGVPSKEGPNKSKERQEFSFHTYAPFAVAVAANRIQEMTAGQTTRIAFNNQLNTDVCKASMFGVSPPVKKFKVTVDYEGVSFSGDFKLGVIYTLTMSRSLRDIHDQALTGPASVRYHNTPLPPQIFHPADSYGQIVPSAKPTYHVWSYNEPTVKVSILKASASDWKKYLNARSAFFNDKKAITKLLPSLPVLMTRNFQTSGHSEKWFDVALDLKPYVKDGGTHFIFVVESPDKENRSQRFVQWIEYSSIRMNVFNDTKSLHAMVTDIRTGKAVSGAELTLLPSGAKQTSDKAGLTKFALNNEKQEWLQCDFESKSTVLPHEGAWQYLSENGKYIAYKNTDRNLYRPGETVRVHGLLRWLDWLKNGELAAPSEKVEVNYSIKSSNSTELATGASKIDKNGAFSFEFKIPETVELGSASVSLTITSRGASSKFDAGTSNFSIQEFRRPEFEVSVDSDKREIILGDLSTITAKGTYRTGSGMAHSKVHWHVKSKPATFSTALKTDFSFNDRTYASTEQKNNAEISLDGISAADGLEKVRLACASLANIEPVDLIVAATMQDLNRQEWSNSTAVKVHPASVYVGLRQKNSILKAETPKVFEFVVTDAEGKGKMLPDYSVQITASRIVNDGASNAAEERLLQKFDITSDKDTKTCTFDFKDEGDYVIAAKVTDNQGRLNSTKISAQVVSDERAARIERAEEVKPEEHKVTLKLNKEHYAPQESAEIAVHAPFASGHGVLVAKNDLIVSVVPFDVVNQQADITLPINDSFYPQVETNVYLYGPNNATASGDVTVDVPTDPVNLTVTSDTQSDSFQPGQTVNLKVSLKDASGKALSGAQVALAVVDESILALTKYTWSNPLSQFYEPRAYIGEDIFTPTLINQHELQPEYADHRPSQPLSALPPPPLPGGSQFADGFRGVSGGMAPPPPPMVPMPSPSPSFKKESADPHYAALQRELYFQKFPAAREGGSDETPKRVKLRSDLNPLAYYNPAILTGSDGSATVSFTLPGNLTKYEVMAVAVNGVGQFGAGNSTFTASLPLMVRPSLPRFLNYKDQCELPFVVQNGSDEPVTAELIVRANHLFDPSAASESTASKSTAPEMYLNGKSFEIPANDRVEVRLPVTTNSVGTANVQVATFANGSSDASELSIPLQAPVTSESFATYGQIDEGAVAQKIMVPSNVINEVGGLEVTTSSTAMQQLHDAGEYLKTYPYACSEQLSSQLLGLGALNDLVTRFKTAAQDVDANQVLKLQNDNVTELCKRQQADGGFGLWVKDESAKYPFVSIQCARALFECSKRNIPVPEKVMRLCKTYLKNIDLHWTKEYLQAERTSLSAYALNVRFQNNDSDAAKAKKLIADAISVYQAKNSKSTNANAKNDATNLNRLSNNANNPSLQELLPRVMTLESMAWLLPVLSVNKNSNANEIDAIVNILSAGIDETSSTASISENPYGFRSYLMYYSPSRLNAVVLESLITSQPKNDVIPKMVKALLQQRRNGQWLSTQENACSLLALSKYFSVYEKDEPDFVAQFWLGDSISFEEKFVGRQLDSNAMRIPMEYLQANIHDELLTLTKRGAGRLYYRVGMKCASKDLKVPATSRGFTVERTYLPVDSASDVTRDATGTLHVKAGATLKVVVKISNPGMRYHVAMVDPFPAGFEALNPENAGTRVVSDKVSRSDDASESNHDLPADNSVEGDTDDRSSESSVSNSGIVDGLFWHQNWFDHQNFRDNQAEAFTTLLPSGEVEYTYFVHATTPGTFIVPPCKVEEMYSPETFGRTACETVVIK